MSPYFLVLLCFLGFSTAADILKLSEYSRVMRSGQCHQECAVCGDGYSCASSCSKCEKPDCMCATLSMDVITIPGKLGVDQKWSSIDQTLEDCNYACAVRVGCVAYGYKESLKYCELYDKTPAENLRLIEDDQANVYIRKCFKCSDIKQ